MAAVVKTCTVTTKIDKSGQPIATYIELQEGCTVRTHEVVPGMIMFDYNADNDLIGIELLSSTIPDEKRRR